MVCYSCSILVTRCVYWFVLCSLMIHHCFWQRPCLSRRAAVNPETPSFLDTDPAFVTSRPEIEVFGTRYYRHIRHPSPDGLARVCSTLEISIWVVLFSGFFLFLFLFLHFSVCRLFWGLIYSLSCFQDCFVYPRGMGNWFEEHKNDKFGRDFMWHWSN
jgi:hypothetical protein